MDTPDVRIECLIVILRQNAYIHEQTTIHKVLKLMLDTANYFSYNYNLFRNELEEYLFNASNKEELVKNFAQITVYNERLSVTKIQEVEAYSLDNLFSDIGKYKY